MPVPDFAYWLGKFVLEIRKQTGTEYPPKTLYAIVCCFKRYFERNEVCVNPLSPLDPRFGNFQSTLVKRLHGTGLGVSKKQAEPISNLT